MQEIKEDDDSTSPDTTPKPTKKLIVISPESQLTPLFIKTILPSHARTATNALSVFNMDKRSDGYLLSLILLTFFLLIAGSYSKYILYDIPATKFAGITKIISKEVLKVPVAITDRVLNEYLNRWSSACILKYGFNGDVQKEMKTFINNLDVQKQFEKKMDLFNNIIFKYENLNEVLLSSFLTDFLKEDSEEDITIDKEDLVEDSEIDIDKEDSIEDSEYDSEFEKKEDSIKQIFNNVISHLIDFKERTNTLFTVGGSFEETCPDISKGIIKIAEQEYKLAEHNIIAKILNEKEIYDMKFKQVQEEVVGGTITVFIAIILFSVFFRKIFIINSVIKCCKCKNEKNETRITIEDKDDSGKKSMKKKSNKSMKKKYSIRF